MGEVLLAIRRFLFNTRIERDDYRDRYEHQYEMKCKARDELDAAEKRGRDLYHRLGSYATVLFAPDERVSKLEEALQWCSGSGDFAPGGKARRGWVKLCQPLLRVRLDVRPIAPGTDISDRRYRDPKLSC